MKSVVPDKYRLQLQQRHLSAGFLDIYDILELTGVEDKELDHAAKKILCSGRRGKGDRRQDVTEAIVALQRYLERHDAIFEKDEEKIEGTIPGFSVPEKSPYIDFITGEKPYRHNWGDEAEVKPVISDPELLTSETPLCNHGLNKDACDRCWKSEPADIWEVNTYRSTPPSNAFEVSLIPKGTDPGGWGWGGPRKIILFSTGVGGNAFTIGEPDADAATAFAEQICAAMNSAGIQPPPK